MKNATYTETRILYEIDMNVKCLTLDLNLTRNPVHTEIDIEEFVQGYP